MDPHWASPLLCWSPRLPLLPQLPPCYHDYLELPLILLLNTNTTTHTNTNTQDTRLPRASSCSARAAHKQSHTQCRTPTSIVPNNKYLSLRLDRFKKENCCLYDLSDWTEAGKHFIGLDVHLVEQQTHTVENQLYSLQCISYGYQCWIQSRLWNSF